MERLDCHVKEYAWGKRGCDSEVARLFAAGHEDFQVGEDTPYAELWMGTHPDGPARLRGSSQRLSSHIAKSESASYLSNNNNKREDIHLPFIMKVMSIRTTLSLQVHPTKEQAARLHAQDPLHYPDRNHKPELAYALTRFELLCGFRPADEIVKNLKERGALTESTVGVIQQMSEDFPGDVGCFSPLYLNHMVLEPGECCYYAAEELHAYLSGECVECVGCSNNTIRAAMTPKFIDREALCEVLNYRMTPPEKYLVPPQLLQDHPHVDLYSPDCRDFQLHRIRVKKDTFKASLPALECASIMVVVSGEATLEDISESESPMKTPKRSVKRGDIIYIPPERRLRVVAVEEDIEAYRTFSFELGPDHESRTVVPKEEQLAEAKRVAAATLKAFAVRPTFTVETDEEDESKIFAVESEMDGFM